MKWDKENKLRLYKAIRAKLEDEGLTSAKAMRIARSDLIKTHVADFFSSFGIRKVQKIKEYHGPPWDTKGFRSWLWRDAETREPAAKSGRIIILDPYYGPEPITDSWSPPSGEGLSIPKDVAERFLVLGIP